MNITNLPEDIKTLTRSYAGLRSSDGRPHVSDDLLARMKSLERSHMCRNVTESTGRL